MSKSRARLAADWFAKLRVNQTTQEVEHADVATVEAEVSAYTAEDVLSKVQTVAGSGSGLDADLLDGLDSTAFVLKSGDTMSGQLGINNASPTIYLQDTDNRSSMIHCNSNLFYILRGSGTNSTSWATYNGNWPLVINLENNDATFGGNLTAVGNVTAYSDERLKSDIQTIENAVDTVKALRGVTFVKDGKPSLGVIAQEVQAVLPELVMESGDYLSVAYGNMVGVLIEAIKEQQAQIDDLKAKLGV